MNDPLVLVSLDRLAEEHVRVEERPADDVLGPGNDRKVDLVARFCQPRQELVTTEAAAFRIYLNRVLSPENQERPVLLVQIGHDRTVVYIHWKSAPVICREIAWGGKDLTLALAKRYQVQVPQAEQTKLDHGFVIPPSQRAQATAEQVDFSDALLEPVQQLVWHLRQAKVTCKSHTQHNLAEIYVSGGTASLPGLARVIEEALELPVKPLQALTSVATSGVTYSERADATFLTATALALCFVGQERGTVINLRKGSFAKAGRTREVNFSTLRAPLLAAAAIILCFFVSMSFQAQHYRGEIDRQDTRLKTNVERFFGPMADSAKKQRLASPTKLKTDINAELNRKRDLARLTSPNPHEPLDFLKELSAAVPRDVIVDMTNFTVGSAPAAPFAATDPGDASLTFLVQNPASVERLSGILGGLMKPVTHDPGAAQDRKRIPQTVARCFHGKTPGVRLWQMIRGSARNSTDCGRAWGSRSGSSSSRPNGRNWIPRAAFTWRRAARARPCSWSSSS